MTPAPPTAADPALPVPALRQPVLLLGMHRSGTSLIARVLDALGLFQGADLQDDHESMTFLEFNDRLLRRIGASWDNPTPCRPFLENERALELTARCFAADATGRHIKPYLGLRRYLKLRSPTRLDSPWGWKDPRTVFTLPAWLKVFPGAKLVYIVRNGIDVAASLRVREQRELDRRLAELPAKLKQLNKNSMLDRAGFKGSSRCLSLAGGFALWEEYVAEAERLLAAVPNERLVVRYEQFLQNPAEGLPELAAFCGLSASPDALRQAAATVNAGRMNAFLGDRELKAFYEQVRQTEWMRRYAYHQLAGAD
jgi:hypothetical protein